MSSGVDRGLLTESVTRARVSDRLLLDFVTGAIRGLSFQQSLIAAGSTKAARLWGQVKRFTEVGVGALYQRGVFRACKHPFDFRSATPSTTSGPLGSGGSCDTVACSRPTPGRSTSRPCGLSRHRLMRSRSSSR